MDLITLMVTVVFMCLAAGFGVLFARLTSRDRLHLPPEEWEGLFSLSRYKAMERLLDDTDRQFLWSHPKFNQQEDKTFRAKRVKIRADGRRTFLQAQEIALELQGQLLSVLPAERRESFLIDLERIANRCGALEH